jgi:hypothetical protein
MRADAPGEGCGDTAMLEVELGVADLSLRIINGSLRRSQLGSPLVDIPFRFDVAAFQCLCATQLAIGICKPCGRRPELRIGLCQPEFVRARVDGEEEITLMNDVSILEIDPGQRAADLSAELDAVDRGKLTKEAQPGTNLAHERLADHNLRERTRSTSSGRVAPRVRTGEPCRRDEARLVAPVIRSFVRVTCGSYVKGLGGSGAQLGEAVLQQFHALLGRKIIFRRGGWTPRGLRRLLESTV